MNYEWIHNEERMELRQKVYTILLNKFGGQLDRDGNLVNTEQSINDCCDDWVSKGHVSSNGIVNYYQAYYAS